MEPKKLEKIQNCLANALPLIQEIEKTRNSTLISFICEVPISSMVAYKLNKILRKISNAEKIDVLIDSAGGDIDATAKIAKLIHKRCKEFNAIVPFYAKSAATFLALKADNIYMCKSGELGPVDPQIFHPTAKIWIPAHSIKDAVEFIEETKDPLVKLSMADKLDPLLMGAYRDAIKATEQHIEEVFTGLPDDKREIAIHTFTGKFRSHGYPINGELCKGVGLNAPNFKLEELEGDLENKVNDLHELYVDLAIELKPKKGILIIQTKDYKEVEVDGEDITSQLVIEKVKTKEKEES